MKLLWANSSVLRSSKPLSGSRKGLLLVFPIHCMPASTFLSIRGTGRWSAKLMRLVIFCRVCGIAANPPIQPLQEPAMLNAVLFDLDNTLIDRDQAFRDCVREHFD